MNSVFQTLLYKEIIDAMRDRRALMGALLYALFGPVILASALNFAIANKEDDKAIYIDIKGAEYAPVLVEKLAQQHILPLGSGAADDEERWREQPITLEIPETYRANIEQAKKVSLSLWINTAEEGRNSANQRVKAALQQYGNELATYRLVLRGIDPHLLAPYSVDIKDHASAQEKSGMVMGMLAVFVLMSVFVASTSIAIDTSAGERERNALELILIQPITTTQLIGAKLIAVSLLGSLGAFLTLCMTSLVMGFVPLAKMGIGFELNALTIITITLAMLPLAIFAAAFQLFCAFQAKSFKEAQSYISLTIMVPLTIPFAVQFMPHKPDWVNWVPVASQSGLIESIAKGQEIDWLSIGTGAMLTLLLAAILAGWLTRTLKSEKAILALS
ncbi:ABC transporter permease [Simiduia aestuariiviva]|uniref:Sodium transport system permease protein n=1 Tax=Simiduia aestuariiviva TaxID=1510459 RepID=A0A839UQ51_9GAMM|nr:ABC transporter permease [Simiduia aestuariiviva]MBB3167668.1 sodium transport system permease protein [Simiduia aestuariiviva]